jgi:ferrous iron transport protein A
MRSEGVLEVYGAPSSNRKLPLGMLPEGAMAKIVEIHGGRGLCRRLAELGFSIGGTIRLVKSHSPGPVVVEVRDSRVAIGRGVAMKVMVEEVARWSTPSQ